MAARNTRVLVGAVVALALLGLLLFFLWHKPAPRPVAKTPSPAEKATRVVPVTGGSQQDQPPEEVIPEERKYIAYSKGRPIMTGVTVEPARVCAGQPFVVKIAAKDPDGKEGEVFTGVGDERGTPWVGTFAAPGERQILAQAFNMRGDYEQRPVDLVVNRCDNLAPALDISAQAIAEGQWAFTAHLPADGGDAKGLAYTWDLGDGQTAETTTPYLEHDYRSRPMGNVTSAFLVKVVATRGDDHFEGMTSVAMVNLYMVNRDLKGVVAPDVIVQSGSEDEQGNAVIKAVVRHWENEVLAPTDIKAKAMACNGVKAEPIAIERNMLSATSFHKGETPLVVRIPAAVVGGSCSVIIEMTGRTSNGRPLYLNFGTAVRRPDLPPRGAQPLEIVGKTDPRVQAQLVRLHAAAKVLGRDLSKPGTIITEDEMRRLEAEGSIPPLAPPPP